jgi:diguanylate cyclase (GGDEF)-like protein/PAS domain S-box-containing protein
MEKQLLKTEKHPIEWIPEVGTCPVTGLPIRQKSEWINVYCSKTFRCSYKIIGSQMILFLGNGLADYEGEKIAVDTGNSIIAEFFPDNTRYIMLQDWTRFQKATFKARQYFIDDMVRSDRLMGAIFFNGTEYLKMSTKLGRALNILPYKVRVENDYTAALQQAIKILKSNNFSVPKIKPEIKPEIKTDGLTEIKKPAARNFIWWDDFLARMANAVKEIVQWFTGKSRSQHQAYIDDLLRYLENITLKAHTPVEKNDVDASHPLLPVFDAITLIKAQLKNTFTQRDKVEQDLRNSEAKYRELLENANSAIIRQKKAEEELAEYQLHLENLVDMRTEAVQRSEEHYRVIYENAPIGIFHCTREGRFLDVNLQMSRIFDYPDPAAFLSALASDTVSESQWADFFTNHISTIGISGKWVSFEQSLLVKSGKTIQVQVMARYVVNADQIEGFLQDISCQKEAEQNLLEMATLDSLTGINNRRKVLEIYHQEFKRSIRYNVPLSVCMIDIDRFKSVNDRFGHETGDIVLSAVAGKICEHVRHSDVCGRYGGEEFLVVFPHTGLGEVYVVMERLRQAVAETIYPVDEASSLKVTISIGIAELTPDIETPDALIRHSDQALYAAKAAGRDRICLVEDIQL